MWKKKDGYVKEERTVMWKKKDGYVKEKGRLCERERTVMWKRKDGYVKEIYLPPGATLSPMKNLAM
jgi:hypothetical protein